MAKQSAPIQEVARLLDLVPYLSAHPYISIKNLAAEFNVTEKEMINELSALSMCGLPGYTPYELIEVYFDSGFVTINNHEALDIPRALTNLEIASLLIGLSLMRESSSEHPDLTSRIDALSRQFTELLGGVIEMHTNPEAARLSEIERAISARYSLQISYLSPIKDEVEVRTVDPLSIYSENSHTYLSAYCHNAGGYRNFRVDRVSEIVAGEKKSLVSQAEKEEDSATAEFQLEVLGSRRSISEFLTIEAIPSHGRIDYQAFSSDWVERAVITFSPDVVLHSPLVTRAEISRKLANVLALYQA